MTPTAILLTHAHIDHISGVNYLQNNGIGSQVLYIPVFLHPYYKRKYNYKPNKFSGQILIIKAEI